MKFIIPSCSKKGGRLSPKLQIHIAPEMLSGDRNINQIYDKRIVLWNRHFYILINFTTAKSFHEMTLRGDCNRETEILQNVISYDFSSFS